MKKHIYIFLALLTSLLFVNMQSVTAQTENDITIDASSTDSGNSMRRAKKLPFQDEYDRRLDNSKYIIEIRKSLSEAIDVHNYASTMLDLVASIEGYKNIIASHEYAQQQLSSNESCNISLLSPYYHDPKDTWGKVSTWAYNTAKSEEEKIDQIREETATAMEQLSTGAVKYKDIDKDGNDELHETSVVAAERGATAFFNNDNLMSKKMISIRHTWDVGHRALTDLYANQSKWGKKKYPFPLWGDQKYLYDSQWNRKYGAIKKLLVETYSKQEIYNTGDDTEYRCVLEGWVNNVPDKGPVVADIYKYDHEDYDPELGTRAILKAHNNYVKLIQKRPSGINLSVMHAPPHQLPPLKESLYYLIWEKTNNYEKHFTPYPGFPNVWRTFMNGYVFYNQGREDHFYNPVANPNEGHCPKYVHANAFGSPKYSTEMGQYLIYYLRDLNRYSEDREMGRERILPDAFPSNLKRIEPRGFRRDSYPFIKNRVQTYLENRLHEEMMRPLAEESKEDIKIMNEWIVSRLSSYGIEVNKNFDVSNINDYNYALNQLALKQQHHLGEARKVFDTLTPTNEHLLDRDMESYKLFGKAFDTIVLDKDMVARVDLDSLDNFPEEIIEAKKADEEVWELIKLLRQPPTSPEVGCPIL